MRLISLILVFLGSVGCDQVTKQVAQRTLRGVPMQSYLGDTFRLLYIENTGAFLGMASDWAGQLRWVAFTLFASVIVVVSSVVGVRRFRRTNAPWFSSRMLGPLLVAAGGLGNLIDRVSREGAVVDFMNAGIGELRTGIFNVADVQIMIGCALWAFWASNETAPGPPGAGSSAEQAG